MCIFFSISNVVLIASFALHHYAVCRSFNVCDSGFVIFVVILFDVVIGTIFRVGIVVMGLVLSKASDSFLFLLRT